MPAGRIIAFAASAVVIASIIAGLMITGSPQTQRDYRFDERRIADLQGLSQSVRRYFRDTGNLPNQLADLVDGRIRTSLPGDPDSAESYGYNVTDVYVFELCASFTRDSEEMRSDDDFWFHLTGQQCFEFDFSESRRE